MRRLFVSLGAAALVCGFVATPAASAQQSVNLFIGAFHPRAEDARDPEDVLVGNRSLQHPLVFSISDFDGATVGGEWLIGLGDIFEAGLGLGFYQRSVPTVNRDRVFEGTGAEIESTLKLRVVPFSATVRFVPFGRHAAFQPYVGAGVGAFAWRYSESGDFLASDDVSIVHGTFTGSGGAGGPVVLGGVRVPLGRIGVGGEIRYQSARRNLPSDQGFAGTKIDLGGFNYLFTMNIGF